MMCRKVRDLPHSEAVAVLRPHLPGGSPSDQAARDLLTDVLSNGLLVEREQDVIAFTHHSFQEYLAATHIAASGLGEVLVGTVDDDWWHLTTLLYAARNDAGPVVRACLASLSVNALALALDCAAQNEEVDAEFRESLDDLFESAFDPGTGAERRDLLARAILTQHLRDVVRAGDGGQVVARPVTVRLYRLFLRYAPEQLLDGRWLDGRADDDPVVGVRAEGALALIQWINDLTNGTRAYRLPTRTEFDDPAVRGTLAHQHLPSALLRVWLKPDHPGEHPRLRPTSQNPYTVGGRTLARQLDHDFALGRNPTRARLRLVRAVALFCGSACARDLARAVTAVRDDARTVIQDLRHIRLTGAYRDHIALTIVRNRISRIDARLAWMDELVYNLAKALGGVRNLDLVRDSVCGLEYPGGVSRLMSNVRNLLEPPHDHTELSVHTVQHASELLHGIDRYLDRYHDHSRDLATRPYLDEALVAAFDDAIALLDTGIVDRDAGTQAQMSDFLTALCQQFVRRTVENKTASYTVPSHVLADRVREAGAALEALVASTGSSLPPWVARLAASFDSLALSVATGAVLPTDDRAAVIRVAGLVLATEVHSVEHRTAEMLRTVVAGVTLLQLRHNGQAPVSETVVLALR